MSKRFLIFTALLMCCALTKAQFPATRSALCLNFTLIQSTAGPHWVTSVTNMIETGNLAFRCWIEPGGKDLPHMVCGRFKNNAVTTTTISRPTQHRGDSTFLEDPVCSTDDHGNIYAAWLSPEGLMFQHSADTGHTWLLQEKSLVPAKGGWLYTINGLKINGKADIACDLSQGEHKGRVYICWSDEKYGKKDKDVFLMYSDDKGENWTEPILVSYRANHKAQFAPSLFVDKNSGDVYIVYYDQQNDPDDQLNDIYLAISKNGGLKFDYFKVNDKSFRLAKPEHHNNYNFLAIAGREVPEITWYDKSLGKERLYYKVILNDTTWAAYNKKTAEQEQISELPRTVVFSEHMTIPFHLKNKASVTAVITRPLDPAFSKPVVKKKNFVAGKNTLLLDAKALKLEKGNYTLFLYSNGSNAFTWITEE